MHTQHYAHWAYYFMNVILEIAIMTVVLWEASNRVNYFTFEVAGWTWPTQWENMCF